MHNDSQLDFLIKNMAEQHQPELPSPGLIWWRAQIQRKFAERERVERPIAIMRIVALAVCVALGAGILLPNWRQITPAINGAETGSLLAFGVAGAVAAVLGFSLLFKQASGKN